MAPGSFASTALARSLSTERIETRAAHIRHTVVSTSTTTIIDILKPPEAIPTVVKKVHATASDQDRPFMDYLEVPSAASTTPPSVSRRTAISERRITKKKSLTPSEQLEAMLTNELREKRRREIERATKVVWW